MQIYFIINFIVCEGKLQEIIVFPSGNQNKKELNVEQIKQMV